MKIKTIFIMLLVIFNLIAAIGCSNNVPELSETDIIHLIKRADLMYVNFWYSAEGYGERVEYKGKSYFYLPEVFNTTEKIKEHFKLLYSDEIAELVASFPTKINGKLAIPVGDPGMRIDYDKVIVEEKVLEGKEATITLLETPHPSIFDAEPSKTTYKLRYQDQRWVVIHSPYIK